MFDLLLRGAYTRELPPPTSRQELLDCLKTGYLVVSYSGNSAWCNVCYENGTGTQICDSFRLLNSDALIRIYEDGRGNEVYKLKEYNERS